MTLQTVLPADHPMMIAWTKFTGTDEFKNALRWSVKTKYDDGRLISNIQREQHANGSLWLAFTEGWNQSKTDRLIAVAPELLQASINVLRQLAGTGFIHSKAGMAMDAAIKKAERVGS